MSDDITKTTPGGLSFEQQVLDRLDAIDHRLTTLEEQAERRSLETKPIWERALAEILEVKQRLGEVEQRLGGVEHNLSLSEAESR